MRRWSLSNRKTGRARDSDAARVEMDRLRAENERLREVAEFAAYACLPLLPLEGANGHYRVTAVIDPTLRATVEEWATAAHHVAELFEALGGSQAKGSE